MSRDNLRSGAVMALVALVGCFVAAATYKVTSPATGADNPVRASLLASAAHLRTTPTPAAFGRVFVEALNGYAASNRDGRRLADPHCVEASKGHYLCSYVLVLSNGVAGKSRPAMNAA